MKLKLIWKKEGIIKVKKVMLLLFLLISTIFVGCSGSNREDNTKGNIISDNFYMVEEISNNFLDKNISDFKIEGVTEDKLKQELNKPRYSITYNKKKDGKEILNGKILIYMIKDESTAVYIDIKNNEANKYYIGECNGLDLEKVKQIVDELNK
ncbi:Uncharacterised protein [Clostridium paraputrificum]|uniref:Uncharacterized protein n=1 Tax=Clostridium paraputrificum TaxID=29363 RepID=A0A6N3AIZ8_9CLOT